MSSTQKYAKKTLGPFDFKALKELATNGKINQDTLIRNGEKGIWTKGSELKGLFDPALPQNGLDEIMAANNHQNTDSAPPPISGPPAAIHIPAFANLGDTPAVVFPDLILNQPDRKSTVGTTGSTTNLASQRKKMRFQLLVVGAITSAISLGIGYFAGVEHVKYTIRSRLEELGKAMQRSAPGPVDSSQVSPQSRIQSPAQFKMGNKTKSKGSDIEASRREWISISYGTTIAFKDEHTWTDTVTATGKVLYIMEYKGHTGEYVELFNTGNKDQLRLFSNRMEAKHDKGWETIGSGHWKK